VFLGGEFIVDEYSFTNFDGIGSDSIDVVIFWEQSYDGSTGLLSNATCGYDTDVSLNCVDYGSALPGVYFMETANDFRMMKESNYNFQVRYYTLFCFYPFLRSLVLTPETLSRCRSMTLSEMDSLA